MTSTVKQDRLHCFGYSSNPIKAKIKLTFEEAVFPELGGSPKRENTVFDSPRPPSITDERKKEKNTLSPRPISDTASAHPDEINEDKLYVVYQVPDQQGCGQGCYGQLSNRFPLGRVKSISHYLITS